MITRPRLNLYMYPDTTAKLPVSKRKNRFDLYRPAFQKSDPMPRTVDFQRAKQLDIELSGPKIQLSDKTLASLEKIQQIKETLNNNQTLGIKEIISILNDPADLEDDELIELKKLTEKYKPKLGDLYTQRFVSKQEYDKYKGLINYYILANSKELISDTGKKIKLQDLPQYMADARFPNRFIDLTNMVVKTPPPMAPNTAPARVNTTATPHTPIKMDDLSVIKTESLSDSLEKTKSLSDSLEKTMENLIVSEKKERARKKIQKDTDNIADRTRARKKNE